MKINQEFAFSSKFLIERIMVQKVIIKFDKKFPVLRNFKQRKRLLCPEKRAKISYNFEHNTGPS